MVRQVSIAVQVLAGDRLLENQGVEIRCLIQPIEWHWIERHDARGRRKHRAHGAGKTSREVEQPGTALTPSAVHIGSAGAGRPHAAYEASRSAAAVAARTVTR